MPPSAQSTQFQSSCGGPSHYVGVHRLPRGLVSEFWKHFRVRGTVRKAWEHSCTPRKNSADGTGCGIENKIHLLANNPSLAPPKRLVKILARSAQSATFSLVLLSFSVPKRPSKTVPFRQRNQLTWGGHSIKLRVAFQKSPPKTRLQVIEPMRPRTAFPSFRESQFVE